MPQLGLTRRRFLQLIAAGASTGAAGFAYVRTVEPSWVETVPVTLRLPHLAESLSGLRIAQLSDIHLSRFTAPAKLLDAVTQVNRLRPDLAVLTGDFVGRDPAFATGMIDPLRRLEAPAFAVYGNHDLWSDRAAVGAALAETPVRLLLNESVEAAAGLTVAGIDDAWSGNPQPEAALRAAPSGNTNLLLCHEPDYIDNIHAIGAPIALQLSGHSHGGQVRLPSRRPDRAGALSRAHILPYMAHRYPIGHYRVGNHQLYTNRGLGVWPLPYRFNCRPEITIFTLRPA